MKFKFIAKIFILFLTLNHSSFAFDIEGGGDDIVDGDRNDPAMDQKADLSIPDKSEDKPNHSSSPFDIEGGGDDIVDGDRNDPAMDQKADLSIPDKSEDKPNHSSSPFDIEGGGDDIVDGDRNDAAMDQKADLSTPDKSEDKPNHSSSPFDIEGGGDDIAEGDRNDPAMDQKADLSIPDKSEDKPKRFQELSEVKLKIVNIHSGKQSDLQIKLGEKTTFNDMSLQLEKCYKTVDDRYNKISIAYVIVTNNDFTKHSVTLSSDLALSTIIASQYIVKAECM